MTKEDGGPAFPPQHDPATHPSGMTLRDYFAAQAMQAFLSQSPSIAWRVPDATIAQDAHNVADAMLKAREGK